MRGHTANPWGLDVVDTFAFPFFLFDVVIDQAMDLKAHAECTDEEPDAHQGEGSVLLHDVVADRYEVVQHSEQKDVAHNKH